MEALTIARALIELKTLDKRIEKAIAEFKPITVKVGAKLPGDPGQTIEEFKAQTEGRHQSIVALIDRRRKLKSAIVRSNAITEVVVNDFRMTVTEAIERKNSIILEKQLLNRLKLVFAEATGAIDRHNIETQRRLDQLLQVTFQKESSKVKTDEYDAVAKPFLLNNEAGLVDPLDIRETITALENAIDGFLQEVDIALTESNARTEIAI